MFTVFGRSKILARKQIDSAIAKGELYKFPKLQHALKGSVSQAETFEIIEQFSQSRFESMKPRQCSAVQSIALQKF